MQQTQKTFHPVGMNGEHYTQQELVDEVKALTENLGSWNHSGIQVNPSVGDSSMVCIHVPTRSKLEFSDFAMLQMYGYVIHDIHYWENEPAIWVWVEKSRFLLNRLYPKEAVN